MTCDSERLRFLAEYPGDVSALLEGVTSLDEIRHVVDLTRTRSKMQQEHQGSRAVWQEMAVTL